MKLNEAIEQLKDLRSHCQDFVDKEDRDCVWNYDVKALNIVIKKYEQYSLKDMSIEELIEKYRLQRDEHIIECSKGDASRLKNEPIANKLTQVTEDLEGLC